MTGERTGSLLVLHVADQVLLYKRDRHAPTAVGYWSLIGGHMEAGENPVEALLREVSEELDGFHLGSQALSSVCCITVPGGSVVHYFSAPLTVGLFDLRLRDEGDGLALFTLEQLDATRVRTEDRVAIDLCMGRIEPSGLGACDWCRTSLPRATDA